MKPDSFATHLHLRVIDSLTSPGNRRSIWNSKFRENSSTLVVGHHMTHVLCNCVFETEIVNKSVLFYRSFKEKDTVGTAVLQRSGVWGWE